MVSFEPVNNVFIVDFDFFLGQVTEIQSYQTFLL